MHRLTALSSAMLLILGAQNSLPAQAAPKHKSLEQMWKIIQQQQTEIERQRQEIERLKAQTGHTERKSAAPEELTAAPPSNTGGQEVKELGRKTDILAEEVDKLRTSMAIPEEPKYKSQYGLGPAASKVYGVAKGLSIGGYGEGAYSIGLGNRDNRADLGRIVAYLGYKFSDSIVFNSEIEFEHATTGEGAEERGEVSVEFATLDFFLHPKANIRAGLVLIPMGFINEIHEPPFFHGNFRPEVERQIIPSTWREFGAGLFGELLPGLQYRVYAVNGLNAEEYSSAGIREGRQGGSNSLANDLAFTGRLDYAPPAIPGLLVGASAFLGNAGQDKTFAGRNISAFTQLYEGHLQYRYRGLELRALGAWGHISDAGTLSAAKGQTIGKSNFGAYGEIAYDIMPLLWSGTTQYLAPFFRYERLDTIASVPTGFADDGSFDQRIYQFGLSYKPIPNVVLKADYRNISVRSGSRPDEFNLGLGFIF